MYSDDVQVAYQEGGYGVTVIPSVAAKAKAPDIVGIENFLLTAMDGIYPATPLVATESASKARRKSMSSTNSFLTGRIWTRYLSDLNARYNAALEKVRGAGNHGCSREIPSGFDIVHTLQ
ncbi:hypothetical protein [Paenibacillus antibioticophila]|uniref:hypothetical protein n=1 Tax=Paenibacillus antibioticophila TaxID=1274374 RepID=UPI00067832E0|nr:hypothetical protein [Paenibacillus antibioticophila]